ncbi:hypothetical protein M885DRAFT_549803 [Pelagophyceae sp. CCMP2097]|nr:hypothetical protein M885DRAFT_549803 [Pelagophyceae sp. CCMP2097]|mmetsp:Transcript_28346/g.97613  ORF Transcript_28346/g.97613 Transcript_28346/m.97613 type:complete len:400 (+) Transcript_28346:43-1242(+)
MRLVALIVLRVASAASAASAQGGPSDPIASTPPNGSATSAHSAELGACFGDARRIACAACDTDALGGAFLCDCSGSHRSNAANACASVISATNASSVLVHPQPPPRLGFTSQLDDFLGHLADACTTQSHFIYGGFHIDAGMRAAPVVPVDFFLAIEPINAFLQNHPTCHQTRVLPWACSAVAQAGGPEMLAPYAAEHRCTRSINWKLAAPIRSLGGDFMASLPLDFRRAAKSAGVGQSRPPRFNAVHFNLDCDWLLYMEKRDGKPDRMKKFKFDFKKANAVCDGSDANLKAIAFRSVAAYVNATRKMGDQLPVLVATSIGKAGHEATQWVFDAYRAQLPGLTFFKSGAASKYREVNAAAELSLLLEAECFVGLGRSTFSKFVALRLRRRPAPGRVWMVS